MGEKENKGLNCQDSKSSTQIGNKMWFISKAKAEKIRQSQHQVDR